MNWRLPLRISTIMALRTEHTWLDGISAKKGTLIFYGVLAYELGNLLSEGTQIISIQIVL